MTLNAKLPDVGIYSSDKISEDTFICTANREASFSFDDSTEYYLLVDMTYYYSVTLEGVSVYTWVNGKKKYLDKDDYINCLKKLLASNELVVSKIIEYVFEKISREDKFITN